MTRKWPWICVLMSMLFAPPVVAQDAVGDYEIRLEEIAVEIQAVQEQLDELILELAGKEVGQVLVFLRAAAPAWIEAGLQVQVDGRVVFSRALTATERELLERGVPVEVADLQLAAGAHRIRVAALADPPGAAQLEAAEELLEVPPGQVSTWTFAAEDAGVQWRVE